MPQITDLNIAPYYDDFDKEDNFHRVLFRPGFAIQARELTTLQSILQNQVERFGRHMFQEGSVVVPGQVTYSSLVTTVQLASTFSGETIVPSQYFNATTPVIVTGATSGIQAQVIGVQEGTATTQPILILRYLNSGSDNETESFADGENISADISITHNTTYGAAIASATTFSTGDSSSTEVFTVSSLTSVVIFSAAASVATFAVLAVSTSGVIASVSSADLVSFSLDI